MNIVKTAISLPDATYHRAESLRRKTGKSRSRLYADALDAYFGLLELREAEAKYCAGYRALPEELREISAALKASSSVLESGDW